MLINAKVKWLSLLFLASILFLIGLYTQLLLFFLATGVLAFYVRQNGYDILFKEFDDERKIKKLKMEALIKEVKARKQADRKTKENKGGFENE